MSLTHTPAYTSSHPDRFEDENTGWGYSVLQDIDAEDPRSWIEPEHAALWAYNQPRLAHSVAADKPSGNVAINVFARYVDEHDEQTALELTRRYLAAFHPEEKIRIAIETITGYSQGDWLGMVAAVAEGYGTPESHIDTFRQWAFGDVWIVIPDGKPGLSGIYAEDAEEAVKYYRENYEDDEPVEKTIAASGPTWDNALPQAIAECLADREEPEVDLTVAWLKEHENDDVVWTALNRLFDQFQQLATNDQE